MIDELTFYDLLDLQNFRINTFKFRRNFGRVEGTLVVEDGERTLKNGVICAPIIYYDPPEVVKAAVVECRVLKEDQIFTQPSSAAFLVVGNSANGWTHWKNKDGKPIDIYRRNKKD